LKVASDSIRKIKVHIQEAIRKRCGRLLKKVIEELIPLLRGWVNYFRLSAVKIAFAEMDSWIRQKLRSILWRQWKKPRTRVKKLLERGIDKARAYTSAYNGRGPW
jgi:RNA-directed DNA polymerase